jgi:hypothetical protein
MPFRVRKLNDALPLVIAADEAVAAAKKAKRALTTEEQALVNKVNALVNDLVQVDAFDKLGKEKYEESSYVRPALRGTKFANLHVEATVNA